MKRHLIALLVISLSGIPRTVQAAVVYSGVQNISIPQSFEGVYLDISSGSTTSSLPGTWSTAPWLNPFFGGIGIANSPFFLPVITGADQIVKLAPGTTIGAGSSFVVGESGSSTHVGPASNQFQPGSVGFIGYKFQMPGGGTDFYGWMRMEVNTFGAGKIVDWAYENTPGAGIAAVPEPGEACQFMLLLLPGACLLFRRRRH